MPPGQDVLPGKGMQPGQNLQSGQGMQPSQGMSPGQDVLPGKGMQPGQNLQPSSGGQQSSAKKDQPQLRNANRTNRGNRQRSNTNVNQPNQATNGRGTRLLETILGSIIMFLVVSFGLFYAFTAISGLLSDNDKGVDAPNFSTGTSMWDTISRLLPEFPEFPDINKFTDVSEPKDFTKFHDERLAKELEKIMPDTVWAPQDKNGKTKISEDFWHALKEAMKQDDSILTLGRSGISDDLWSAIKSRIESTGIAAGSDGTSKASASIADIELLIDSKVSRSWVAWLEQNDKALKKALTGVALTKDDFIKLFQEETVSYQGEVEQKLTELQERIRGVTRQISKLENEITSCGSLKKHECRTIVESMISKAISNSKLDAIAQGAIDGHANDVLANQVNFFGIGSGARIDPMYSSSAWKQPQPYFKSKRYLDDEGYKPRPRAAALTDWSEEGDCFCAASDLKGYGVGTNNISVILSRNIIPQHLVVEHILPGATLDPGATPKDIEVWAYIEELNLRNEVRTWSKYQFPDTPKEDVLNEGWVKIGHVTYDKKDGGNGVQLFKLSDELTRMDAITNHVVIRAINNYGADHTCFYRLKIYGDLIERPDEPPHDAPEVNHWFRMIV
jgi:hypothetical protein